MPEGGKATGLKEALEKSPLWEFKRALVTVLEIPSLVRMAREQAHIAFLPEQLGLPSSHVEPTRRARTVAAAAAVPLAV